MRVSRDALEAIRKLAKDAETVKATKEAKPERELRTYTSPPGRTPDTSEESIAQTKARERFWRLMRNGVARGDKDRRLPRV